MKVLIILIVIIAVGIIVYSMFPLIQVCGDSMYPTYHDSEIILGTRLYRKSKLKIGDVVVYKSPTEEDRFVIKRIAKTEKIQGTLYFFCVGDNADNSYDSRYYGYISSKKLVCKVINQRRNMNNVCN